MHTAIKMPLQSLNPVLVRDLQERYPSAQLHIVVETPPAGAGLMTEDCFWDIIAQLDWSKEANKDIIAPAALALSQYSEQDIRQFSEMLARKLYNLDGERFAKEMAPEEAYSEAEDAYFSVDIFLYARCCVIANGREYYEQVLQDPSQMIKGYTFESLLYLDCEAWKIKTGQDDYFQYTEYWYETFSNPEGWPGIVPLKDRIIGNHG